jgi:hypothetical protein
MVQFCPSQQTTFPMMMMMTTTSQGWANLNAWQLDRASRTPLSLHGLRSAVLSGALRAGTRGDASSVRGAEQPREHFVRSCE